MKVYKLSLPGISNNWLAVSDPKDLLDDIRCAEIDDYVRIDIVDMPKEEFENLKEFEGF